MPASALDGDEREWTVLGASRGEGGILGEGVRQALLRDPTYGPALGAARELSVVTVEIEVVEDPARACGAMLVGALARRAGTSCSTGGSTPRAAYELVAAVRASTWISATRRSGSATSAACRPTTSAPTPG